MYAKFFAQEILDIARQMTALPVRRPPVLQFSPITMRTGKVPDLYRPDTDGVIVD